MLGIGCLLFMNDQEKKRICDLIGQIVDTFVEEWAKTPLHWLQEIDVQCDLFSRLHKFLKDRNICHLKARHSRYTNQHEFSRITCEPYVSLGGTCYAHPDIVIWDDANNDSDTLNSGRWPIIWACEIKYTTGEPEATDLKRLRQILEDNTALSACWIKLVLGQQTSILDQDISSDPRLRIVAKYARLE